MCQYEAMPVYCHRYEGFPCMETKTVKPELIELAMDGAVWTNVLISSTFQEYRFEGDKDRLTRSLQYAESK